MTASFGQAGTSCAPDPQRQPVQRGWRGRLGRARAGAPRRASPGNGGYAGCGSWWPPGGL